MEQFLGCPKLHGGKCDKMIIITDQHSGNSLGKMGQIQKKMGEGESLSWASELELVPGRCTAAGPCSSITAVG